MKTNFKKSVLLTTLAVFYTVLVKVCDVKPIGPNNSLVGLASINAFVKKLFPVNILWYKITNAFGLVAIAICAIFGFIGFLQLVKRKNVFKVDKEILYLGGLYLITIMLYIIFRFVAINFRPVIMPGESILEASFPSSHTMLAIVVFGSIIILLNYLTKNEKAQQLLFVTCVFIILLAVIGRLVCGCHWFSDILGGIIYSGALLSWFNDVIRVIDYDNNGN